MADKKKPKIEIVEDGSQHMTNAIFKHNFKMVADAMNQLYARLAAIEKIVSEEDPQTAVNMGMLLVQNPKKKEEEPNDPAS